MPSFLRVAVGALGSVYLLSALLETPRPARRQLVAFLRSLLPASIPARPVAAVIVTWEVVLGLVLLTATGPVAVWLLLSLFTLVAATLAVTTAARQPQPLPCACFGILSREPAGRAQVLRNVMLMAGTAAAGAAVVEVGWFMAAVACCAIALAGGALVAIAAPIQAPTSPQFTAPSTERLPNTFRLAIQGSESSSRHLVVFVSPGCGGCERATQALDHHKLSCRLVFSVDHSGPAGAGPALGASLAARGHRVLDREVGEALRQQVRVSGFPSYLLLDPDGATVATGIAASELIAAIDRFGLNLDGADGHQPHPAPR